MPLRRPDKDMFGRPAAQAPASAPAPQDRATPQRRAIPPGLMPFMPVVALVLVLIGFAITPWLGLALLGAVCGAVCGGVMWSRYRQVKGIDYVTLRSSDPLWRAWDAFRRGGTRWDDTNRPPE